ncbi:MAG: PIN domain-containing protein [Bryobacteraceae bacterium]|nr:PIN domain-containing protein [Bryobacteraceae bacterium]
MNGREFLDTNVLLYAFDSKAPAKRPRAQDLLSKLTSRDAAAISIQVLQEFFANATKKMGMTPSEAKRLVEDFSRLPTHAPSPADVISAIDLHLIHKISFWDALIIRSAQQMKCETLWSEDLSHGQRFGAVTIRNPFV